MANTVLFAALPLLVLEGVPDAGLVAELSANLCLSKALEYNGGGAIDVDCGVREKEGTERELGVAGQLRVGVSRDAVEVLLRLPSRTSSSLEETKPRSADRWESGTEFVAGKLA